MLKNFNYFLIPFILMAILMGSLNIFLEKIPTIYIENKKDYSFFRIKLENLFLTKKVVVKKVEKKLPLKKLDVTLKSVYLNGEDSFVIINDKGKDYFINLNEEYNGYKLIEIKPLEAIFEKYGNRFSVRFKNIAPTNETKTPLENKKNIKTSVKQINNYEILTTIDKETLNSYKNNQTKIWRNIGIIKTAKGYKIRYIRNGSIFQQMGLKQGDILISVNGRKLKNDADAWDLYKNSDEFDSYEITILRNNKEKVLNYDVE